MKKSQKQQQKAVTVTASEVRSMKKSVIILAALFFFFTGAVSCEEKEKFPLEGFIFRDNVEILARTDVGSDVLGKR